MIDRTKYPDLYYSKDIGTKDIGKLRKDAGLKPIKSGLRPCLKCDKEFLSEDLSNNKICGQCKNNGGK